MKKEEEKEEEKIEEEGAKRNIVTDVKTKRNVRALCKYYGLIEVEMSIKIVSEWVKTNWSDIEKKNKAQLDLFKG